jgi:hypothetical protein
VNRWTKLAVVIVGYLLAFIAGCSAITSYQQHFSPTDFQTMGGMIAGGEMHYGGAVFACVALVPTALALWFLRRERRSWSVFSLAGLAFASLGLAAAVVVLAARGGGPTQSVPLMVIELLGVIQMLGWPLWTVGFALFAALAPSPDLRRRMLGAAVIEVAVAGCAFLHVLPHPFRL